VHLEVHGAAVLARDHDLGAGFAGQRGHVQHQLRRGQLTGPDELHQLVEQVAGRLHARADALQLADRFGADHHELMVKPDAIELLPKLVWHYDQPFADSSAISTYYVAQLTREHVKVALTGDGGDQLFAGYERFAAARIAEFYRRTPPLLRGAITWLVHALPETTSYHGLVRRARRFVESAPLPLPERYLEWVGIFKPDFLHELLIDAIEMGPPLSRLFRSAPSRRSHRAAADR